jgi:murein endopeptidase
MLRFYLFASLVYATLHLACVGGDSLPSTPPQENEATASTTPSGPDEATRPEKEVDERMPTPVTPPPPLPVEHGTSGLLQAVKATLWRPAMVVENAWNALKKIPDQELVHDELRRSKLDVVACRGLINFRALSPEKIPPFGYRDHTRDRSWVRPTVARVLIEGLEKLRSEFPDVTLSIGDLSQPGCGQLSHGRLVRYLADSDDKGPIQGPPSHEKLGPATQLLNATQLQWGAPIAQDLVLASDLGVEANRLETPNEHVLIEHHVLSQGEGLSGELYLKVATQRFRPLLVTDGEAAKRMLRDVRFMIKHGTLVDTRKVIDWRAKESGKLWLYHWVHPETKRQVRLLSHVKIKKRIRPSTVVEIRTSRWQNKKPNSFPGQIRWFPSPLKDSTQVQWSGWRQLYEAGHQTHLAGRDADLSYVTKSNQNHFAVALDSIDLEKSWRWFEILDEVSRALKARVDRILVAPSVWRLFKAAFGKKHKRSRVWRLLRRVGGHDAHHHVRIHIPSRQITHKSAQFLKERHLTDDAVFRFPLATAKPQKTPPAPRPPR